MSEAPKTIMIARTIGAVDYAAVPQGMTASMGYLDAHRYHHDDVVHELVEALRALANDAEALADSEGVGVCDKSLSAARAVLAKITEDS